MTKITKWIMCFLLYVFLVGAGMAGVACFTVVKTLESIEYGQIVEVIDGKENFYITLWLGPFAYRIDLKERIQNKY